MDGAISVIVPTLNAGRQIDTLLTRLEQQTRKPDEIIVVDSSSEDITQEMIKRHPEVKLIVIDRKNFNHGGTRDAMLRESTGDFVLFLTQDACQVAMTILRRLWLHSQTMKWRWYMGVNFHARMRARQRHSFVSTRMAMNPW